MGSQCQFLRDVPSDQVLSKISGGQFLFLSEIPGSLCRSTFLVLLQVLNEISGC